MKKPASVISIDSARKGDGGPADPTPSPSAPKGKSSGFMTRRSFCGLLFGMGHTVKTAMRETNISTEAATEEIMRHGYKNWRAERDAERKAA